MEGLLFAMWRFGEPLWEKNLKEVMEGAMRKTGGRKFEVPRTNSLKQKQEQE